MPNEKKNNKKEKEEQPNIFEKEEKKEHFFLDFMKRINSEEKKKEVDNSNEKQLKLSFNIQLYGSKIINWLNEQLDSILDTNKKIKWFSLALAIGIYLVVNGGINISNSNYYEILNDVPVQIVGENDLYEVLNVPDTVVINTYGNLIDVQSTKLKNNYYAYIDVSNLSEGNHAVLIQAGNIPNDLGYDIKPESVEITVAKKVIQSFDLGYEFINEQTDSIYTVHDPVLEFSSVKIRASQQTLDSINRVVAIIDANITESKTNRTAEIVAYDANDEIVDVEIIPKEVTYDVNVTSYSKTVDLKVTPTGTVDSNYGIKNITYQPTQIEIYGIEEELADINEVTVTYDVSDLTKTTDFTITIADYLDKAIRKASISKVSGTIEIEEIISTEISDIPINIINNNNNYEVTFANNDKATIRVTGLKSKINKFSVNDVQAYIDLKDVNEGTNEVAVNIIISDVSLKWEWVSNESISIIVNKKE